MPLLLTPAQPFQNDAHLDVAAAYAIIEHVSYATREKKILYSVGYYASEAAYLAVAARLNINALPLDLAVPATPQEANAVGIFDFLEAHLTQQVAALLPDATIETVA